MEKFGTSRLSYVLRCSCMAMALVWVRSLLATMVVWYNCAEPAGELWRDTLDCFADIRFTV